MGVAELPLTISPKTRLVSVPITLATMIISRSTLNTRPVTRIFAPVRCPTLAAVSAETAPDNPSSCSLRIFSNSARSTRTNSGSAESCALISVAAFGPRSFTASSLDSKSNTAMEIKSGVFAARGAKANPSASIIKHNLIFIGILWKKHGQLRSAGFYGQSTHLHEAQLRFGVSVEILNKIVLHQNHHTTAVRNCKEIRAERVVSFNFVRIDADHDRPPPGV